MPFTTWLRTWLTRHPLKEPTGMDRARYTAEVMARVKAVGPMAEANLAPITVRRWGLWPRMAMALAAATAGIAVVVWTRHDPHSTPLRVASLDAARDATSHRFAQAIATDAQLLAALDERDGDLVLADDADVLHDELAIADTMLLAEQSSSDEEWLAQTLELLDQLGEDTPPETASDGAGEEEWLEELQLFDESDLLT